MARGQWGKQPLVPEAHKALDNMKYEIAAELAIPVYQGSEDYWGYISSRDCGAVGGSMTRKLVQNTEQYLKTMI
ncbi:alpha/beta-type small acid-soluble spore protein [Tepidibacillus fermentans]|uniref:Small acid-soluble spore protein alpha/beta type n=1 Tax=Tepidibacillus fermentans TaxID=1281767 RepID=A0A4R3KIN4_9BACI|nr:alpha/beta-type small acid-soluble spore protein [Tepidibacillus fermentans]TCS83349.1 small acid-soluble spore protein alpha/beta type [Tepidibacillus fermentans]